MIKDIIRYIVIILIVVAIALVIRGLVNQDSDWEEDNSNTTNNEIYYQASISLLDKETEEFISGATLTVRSATGEEVDSWITTEEAYTISNLKSGTYTLEQEIASDEYKLNEESITFEVEDTNVDVVMYNEKKTEEELAEEKAQNTTSDEINVDNTLSYKNKLLAILSIIIFIIGIGLISSKVYGENKLFNK